LLGACRREPEALKAAVRQQLAAEQGELDLGLAARAPARPDPLASHSAMPPRSSNDQVVRINLIKVKARA
jgi:hypothetical protein